MKLSIYIFLTITVAVCRLWAADSTEGSSVFQEPKAAVISKSLQEKSQVPASSAQQCIECHRSEWEGWQKSQHANANRLVDFASDQGAFDPAQTTKHGSFVNKTFIEDGKLTVTTKGKDGVVSTHHPEAVIGVEPLYQYLVPFANGRLQVLDMAFDVEKKDWFNVYEEEDRQPHEWGFWKNRAMTWNVQCAFCHMTELDKGYDIATDSYNTTWTDMGISCIQCHGHLEKHAADPGTPVAGYPRSKNQVMDNCASCHTRREEFTGKFKAGDDFFDHYRPTLADAPTVYYPDGQILNEDFEYGSFLMSRMGHAGVTCLDCHDPHSGKLTLPADNNALCITCHAAPGRDGATVIDLATHSRHEVGSEGDSCIECHMAETTYMARDPRRDHGFVIPDPVLTKELGIPNSCNRCHDDKGVDWAIEHSEAWYGEKMERRSRVRARVISRAQQNDPEVYGELLAMIESEEIAAWRATLLSLLRGYAGLPGSREAFVAALKHPHPLVRNGGVNGLAIFPDGGALIDEMLTDPVRLVRLDAEIDNALKRRTMTAAQRAELQEYLDNISDQPGGASMQARIAFADGRKEEAQQWIKKTVAWDPSPGAHHMAARFHYQMGDKEKTEQLFRKAAALEPNNREHPYALALLFAEEGRAREALFALEKAVKIDPQFARGWYNLGLAYAGEEQLAKAVDALKKAEVLMPQSPDPAYARATVHLRLGEQNEARAAARKALQIRPGYQPAQQLLQGE